MFQYMHIVEAWGTGIPRVSHHVSSMVCRNLFLRNLVTESKLLFIGCKRQKQATSDKNKRQAEKIFNFYELVKEKIDLSIINLLLFYKHHQFNTINYLTCIRT